MSGTSLYTDFARWWPLLSPPKAYEEEAGYFERLLVDATDGPVRTVLELGSGGGNNASFLKRRFDMTLVDLAEGMLEVSRTLNPECAHHRGDMRTVRLDRTFDAVFIHDAVTFMACEADLRAALKTAFVHCRPGGGLVIAPDYIRETFEPETEMDGNDGEGRSIRYLEWVYDPDPDDTMYSVESVYLLREGAGPARVVHDHHVEGLFYRAQWLRWLDETGFDAQSWVVPHSELEPGRYEVFFGTRRRLSGAR